VAEPGSAHDDARDSGDTCLPPAGGAHEAAPIPLSPAPAKRRFQFRLRTLLLAFAAVAVVLALARLLGSLTDALMAGVTVMIAIGLLQQTRDLWRARSQLAQSERSLIWGWRYSIGWRLGVISSIIVFWLIESLQAYEPFSFQAIAANTDSYYTEDRFRYGWFYLALIAALCSAPWVRWRRPDTISRRLLDYLGVAAAIYIAFFVLRDATVVESLVHIAIRGIQNAQPYKFAGRIISDIDVMEYNRNLNLLAYRSYAMIGVSLACIGLLRLRTRSVLLRTVMISLVLAGIAVCGTYAYWVHTAGFRAISPVMAQHWTVAPWPCWLFAGLLVAFFAANAAYRLQYRVPDESRQSIIVWHRGPRVYLNESRILMMALIAILVWDFVYMEPVNQFSFDLLVYALQMPQNSYLPLAILWLSVHGLFARRNIPDLDRRMTPVPLSPVDFVITTILVAAITVGLVEAVTWSSFSLWLI
jgi:hypothetical protein